MVAVLVSSLVPGEARLTTLSVVGLVMMLLRMCPLSSMLLVRKGLLNFFKWRLKTYAGYVLSFVALLVAAVVLLSFRYGKCVNEVLSSITFSENFNACGTRYMLGFSLPLGFLPLTGSAQLLGFFYLVSYWPFYGAIASFSCLDKISVLPVLQLNISCISWVLTSFFHLTTFYWMFLEGNFHIKSNIFTRFSYSGLFLFIQVEYPLSLTFIKYGHFLLFGWGESASFPYSHIVNTF